MPRRTAYHPPAHVDETNLRTLLERSGRAEHGAVQLDLLAANAKSSGKNDLTLYYAGNIALVERRAIAVIGTRKVSDVGRKRANRFARELAAEGIVVVSGLAAGVDAQALGGAMKEGGDVIAVIGTPIDKAYPAGNARLQEEIYESHLLISQFAVGTRTFPSHFPARNRTMAALSDASVIIEASESSGTLHQAAECVRLGRWLGISKGVVEDPRLSWPERFLGYPKCVVLESTHELLERVYGS